MTFGDLFFGLLILGLIVFCIWVTMKGDSAVQPGPSPGPEVGVPGASCPVSLVHIKNQADGSVREVTFGTYQIDGNSYYMKVWPPMQLVATGPNGVYEKLLFIQDPDVQCPSPQNVTLDREKTFDTIVLTPVPDDVVGLQPYSASS